MKKIILIVFNLSFFYNTLTAQKTMTLSLTEAISFGLEHNATIKNTQTDIEIARKKILETTAIGLPQINGRVSNSNFINIPTTLLPDFITPAIFSVNEDYFDLLPTTPQGETVFFPVSFGTKYNATAEISVSQLIFNGSYLVGLRAAKAFLEQSKVQAVKSRIEVENSVTAAYFIILASQKTKNILDSVFTNIQLLSKETEEINKQGFIEDIDLDQIYLMKSDLEANLLYATNQIILSKSYFKILLGIEDSINIELSDNFENLLKNIKNPYLLNTKFSYSKHIDYQILENQKELSVLSIKNEQASSLPVLSAFFTAQTNAMRNEYNFFSKKEPWYPTTVWGIQMDIPIFSSFSRSAKINQARLEYKKIEVLESQLKNNLNTEEYNAKTNFKNALMIHQNKNDAVHLAKKIYAKIQLKYKEGVSSSMELLQAYNQYLESEGNYIKSVIDLVNAKLALEKLFTE